jgi:hypothetical protein
LRYLLSELLSLNDALPGLGSEQRSRPDLPTQTLMTGGDGCGYRAEAARGARFAAEEWCAARRFVVSPA